MGDPVAAAPHTEDPNAAAIESDQKGKWPPPDEQLEKWMMNAVREGDVCAKFLRGMLHMNPAYGTYLQTDADLVNVVLMFSKRIKTKIAQYESPSHIPPTALTQPLCELVWRVVGYVMHGVIELEEEANMPVPKEASGMIKMLLHTNSQLSIKLNELRRVYLKELAEHRDKQRRISKTAERAINSLQEQPIMFYEPLEFVLDETTKDFVREAVVERMKLEMRSEAMSSDDNGEMVRYIEELENQVELLKAEAKTARATSNRLEEQMKTAGLREQQLRDQVTAEKEAGEALKKALKDMEMEMKKLQQDIQNKLNKIRHLETKLGEAPTEVAVTAVQVEDNSEEMEALSAKQLELEAISKKKDEEIERLKKRIQELEKGMKGSSVVMTEDPETKRLLDQALKVEEELRKANEAMQKAMQELEKEVEDLKEQIENMKEDNDRLKKGAKKGGGGGPSAEEMDDIKNKAIDKAMKKAKKEWEEEKARMQERIEKLEKKLEKAEKKLEEMEEMLNATPGEKKAKVVKQIGVPEEEHNALKVKCHELETKGEEMEDEYAKLEQKCRMLMDKLKEKFSDSELADLVKKIDMAPPPIRKKRKKKAYERLYDDAQRRIMEMKIRQDKLKQLEEKSLKNMARIAATSRDARKVEMLGHLHNANQAGADRFHDAMMNFQMGRMGGEGGLGLDDESEEEVLRSGAGMSDLALLTIHCFKDGVCPRCAFSALSTFRRNTREHARSESPKATQGSSFGTSWQTGAVAVPARLPDRSSSPPPWLQDSALSRGLSPAGRGGSPFARSGSPNITGPSPGVMPFDAAFPLPAPPWRQPTPQSADGLPPWRQESGANPSMSSGAPWAAASGGAETGQGNRFFMENPQQNINAVPPWRRGRSNSPGKSRSPSPMPKAPPPSGMAPARQGNPGQSPSYGRMGRTAGQDSLPPPVPGRAAGAQGVMLDPIPRQPAGRNAGSSRTPSPGNLPNAAAQRQKIQSDGFRKMNAVQPIGSMGSQFVGDGDPSRPQSTPATQPSQVQSSSSVGSLGGGGHGTLYKNLSAAQLPPTSRSMPAVPVGDQMRAPWESREVPWEPSAAAKRLAPKAKKPGPGFMVTPMMSQERLSQS